MRDGLHRNGVQLVEKHMRLLIVGDVHGNAEFLRSYIYPLALTVGAGAIIQLGDFGAWEHTSAGIGFLDEVGQLAQKTAVPLYWLHGNHDKHSETLGRYEPDERGFYPCRPFVFYIPQGHAWQIGGVRLRSFGGAYSVDKQYRLKLERARQQPESLWFPEEEMTEAQMVAMLKADNSAKDIILSHDKPLSSRPRWNRKAFAECIPNQLRLEQALRVHRPAYWFHGHLHTHYVDVVRGRNWTTTVVGLAPDWDAAEHGYRQVHSWSIVDCENGKADVRLGQETFTDPEILQKHIMALN